MASTLAQPITSPNRLRRLSLLRESFHTSFGRHQPPIWTSKCQLNPKRRGEKYVNFPCLNFLEVTRGDFSPFRQFILRQFLEHPLAAHVRAEDFDSLPFFLGNGHDILHRFYTLNMNDTYIVKNRFP